MSDIFLSYSRSDIASASRLAEAMSRRGWSVWWDSRIGAGLAWELEIDRELTDARCVVVLWSYQAVNSHWVRAEASDAMVRGILVPARIDDATPPALFRAIQTTDLTPWVANAKDPALERLFDGIDRVVRRSTDTRDPAMLPKIVRDANAGSRSEHHLARRKDAPTPATPTRKTRAHGSKSHRSAMKRGTSSAAAPMPPRHKLPSALQADEQLDGAPHSTNVFVQLSPGAKPPGLPTHHLPGIALYEGQRLRDLPRLASAASVTYVDIPDSLAPGYFRVGEYHARQPRGIYAGAPPRRKKGTLLVGIIDIGGFDFAHPDFLDGVGHTRFVRIWDQAERVHGPPVGFRVGSEITQNMMNRAIQASPRFGVAAQELEPQSSMSPGSRATHMASVAAGNGGLCPRAFLAGVLLPQPGIHKNGAVVDAASVALGVEYLFQLGDQLAVPVSIAIGVGTNSATHDESSGIARWLDASLAPAGRCICVGAHAAHQSAPSVLADWDERFARTHTGGKIREAGLSESIEWIVNGDGTIDCCENELHVWYEAQDRFAFSLKPPGGEWIGPLEPGDSLESHVLENGTVVSIYNERLASSGGGNRIVCYLSPRLTSNSFSGVTAGMWRVRLQGRTIRDGRYHGWIVRGEAPPGGDNGLTIPPHFSERSSVPGFSVTGFACARDVLTVANLDVANEVIHPSSARGPTLDGKAKPEVAVPGTDIVAANGFDSPNPRWISMTGMSVAAAYAAGATGLMLAQNRALSAREISDIVKTSALPLPGTDFGWHDDAGYGVIDPHSCVREAGLAKRRRKRTVR